MHASEDAAKLAFTAIHAALGEDERTREPMNALALWTEIGKGLASTLEKKGASPGLIHDVISGYARTSGKKVDVDLSKWAYALPPDERLTPQEVTRALRRVLTALDAKLPELSAMAETDGQKERELFVAVIRGWFPVGLDIVRALPPGATASEAERLSVLAAWCDRYLPRDMRTPADLGVRIEKK